MGTAIIILAGSALVAVSKPGPHHSHSHGTDILHYLVSVTMTNDGVLTNASGTVQVAQNQQGNANHQSLRVSVSGLETNSTYSLYGMVGDDTNSVWAADFTTDGAGHASLRYGNNGHGEGMGKKDHDGDDDAQGEDVGNGHGHGGGKNQDPIPAALDPVSGIRELNVVDSSTQAVLTADFSMPDTFSLLIKRDLSTNGIDASLRIHAKSSITQFRLMADGLTAQSDYWLVLNGDVVETNTADANGRLSITALPDSVTNIFQVHSLALSDTSSNIVISTELP